MGFAVDRIHSLVYQWDAWPQSPRGLFLLASIPSPRTIPESIFFEPTYRSLFFLNSDKSKKKSSKSLVQHETLPQEAITKFLIL
jgi:hypothetical protein